MGQEKLRQTASTVGPAEGVMRCQRIAYFPLSASRGSDLPQAIMARGKKSGEASIQESSLHIAYSYYSLIMKGVGPTRALLFPRGEDSSPKTHRNVLNSIRNPELN
jgi:hypothetical protein